MSKTFKQMVKEHSSGSRKTITVNDKMQKNYTYELTAKEGDWKDEYPDFKPDLTPKEMLELGVFEGKYLNDCTGEFPSSWFKNMKTAGVDGKPDESLNYFKVKSRQPLSVWKEKDWLHNRCKSHTSLYRSSSVLSISKETRVS